MIGVDTNVLIYAHRAECAEHDLALKILTELAEENTPWAVTWSGLYEFVRVVTHPKVFSPPSKLRDALQVIERLIAAPSIRVLGPGLDHWRWMSAVITSATATSNVVFDAQIAAVLLENGIKEILTNDSDFHRFRQLKVINPFT